MTKNILYLLLLPLLALITSCKKDSQKLVTVPFLITSREKPTFYRVKNSDGQTQEKTLLSYSSYYSKGILYTEVKGSFTAHLKDKIILYTSGLLDDDVQITINGISETVYESQLYVVYANYSVK